MNELPGASGLIRVFNTNHLQFVNSPEMTVAFEAIFNGAAVPGGGVPEFFISL